MALLQEVLGIVLVLLWSTTHALGADLERPAGRGVIGALALLVFWLWRRATIAKLEREMMLEALRNETKSLRMALTSQEAVAKELCRLSDLISDVLGRR